VKGPEIKARAAQLRAAGDLALERHLSAQMGQVHQVLMEALRMGRTGQFAEVTFATDHAEGTVIAARIIGHHGGKLLGQVV
jgi:threonylcarbamoyladenosine tRNA methylthiotransferase MtaB